LSLQKKDIDFLVYNKIGDNLLFSSILEYLSVNQYNFKVLVYGKFEQKTYFSLLERSKYLIYLSESESQGLAMFEAWARDVPILAWERGFCQVGKYFQTGLTTTAYLTPETGMRFKDFVNFKAVFAEFVQTKFTPKAYAVANFSDQVCARKYLDIVNEINI
jgi:glycosyltransferase involved in cell wall biosynthesis